MKPFKFTLQAVLTLRERAEQQALHEYSKALRALDVARRRVETAQEELAAVWRQLQEALDRPCRADELRRLQDFCDAVVQRKKDLDIALALARNRADRAFAKYLVAHQARALVEQHFENQKSRHDRERRKHEQKLLDDLARRTPVAKSPLAPEHENLWN